MRARFLHLARQRPGLLVLARRAFAHTGPRRRQLLAQSLATFIQQQLDFSVFFSCLLPEERHDNEGTEVITAEPLNRQI
jgi:hypothetical protein